VEYRKAPVKHADEISWRTNGHHGDAWLFATPRLSLFLFRQTRAGSVPQQAFGKIWLPSGRSLWRLQQGPLRHPVLL
jgi:transposase